MSTSASDTLPMLHQHGLDDLLGQLDGIQQEADQFFGDVMDSLDAAWQRDLAQRDAGPAAAPVSPKVEQQLSEIERLVASLGQGFGELHGWREAVQSQGRQFMEAVDATLRRELDERAANPTAAPAVPEKVERHLSEIERFMASVGQGLGELQGWREAVQSQGRQFTEAVDAALRRELAERAANPTAPPAVPEKVEQHLSEIERFMASVGEKLGELQGWREAVQSQGKQFTEAVDAALRRELDERAANPPAAPAVPEKVGQQLSEIERFMASVGETLGELQGWREAVQSQGKQFTEAVDAALRRELDERAANPPAAPAVPEKVGQQLSEIERFMAVVGHKLGELHGWRETVQAQGRQFVEAVDAALRRDSAERNALPVSPAVPEKVERQLAEIEQFMTSVGQRLGELHGWRDAIQAQSKQFMDALDAVVARMSVQAMISGNAGATEKTEQQLTEIEQAMATVGKQLGELHGWGDAIQSQSKRFTQLADELTAARQDLAEVRATLEQRAGQAAAPVMVPTFDPDLQRRVSEAEEQCSALQQERAALEAELEAVRNRAAEMADATAQQKRQMHDQQAQWASEFKRMRSLLEGLCKQLEDQPPTAGAATSTTEQAAASADLVLDSLANQFEMLQRDVARRRSAISQPRP